MQPYAPIASGGKLHPHNECSICCGEPRLKATARQLSNQLIDEGLAEWEERYDEDWYENIWDNSISEDKTWEDYYINTHIYNGVSKCGLANITMSREK